MPKSGFINVKIGGVKIDKNRSKMTPHKIIENRPKFAQKLICSGGVKIVKNRPRGTGTPKHKFFEICHFFAKTFGFSTPINDPYKLSIPHK
jgi:hypothetical protein